MTQVWASKATTYSELQIKNLQADKFTAYTVLQVTDTQVDKAATYSVIEVSNNQRVSKATAYLVGEGNADVNVLASMAVQYAVLNQPIDSVLVSESVQYALLDPPVDSLLVSEANEYAVLFEDIFANVSKAAAYLIEGFDETRYEFVTKAATYTVMVGTVKVSKANEYVVVNDPTPRYVDASKQLTYGVMGLNGIRLSMACEYAIMDTTPKPEIRVTKATDYCVLDNLNPKVLLSDIVTEPLTGGPINARLSSIATEPLTGGSGAVRMPSLATEPLTGGDFNSEIRCSIIAVEVLCRIPEEPFMTSVQFPTQGQLPGLTFNVTKKPNFSTRIAGNSSGREVRNAFWDDPRWDFELSYDLLRDRPVNTIESELKLIAGFFLQRRGSFEQFLFLDTDDYVASNIQGTADGVTLTYFLRRDFGGFLERIGQVNTARPITVWQQVNGLEATIPVTPGPYTIEVNGGQPIREDIEVILVSTGEPLQRVETVSPGAGAYIVDEGSGLYTFNVAQEGEDVLISYSVNTDSSSYEIVLPNRLVFDAAPTAPAGAASMDIYASFEFYFVCRFTEDAQDYEKFMDKLWELQSCTFRSVIQ